MNQPKLFKRSSNRLRFTPYSFVFMVVIVWLAVQILNQDFHPYMIIVVVLVMAFTATMYWAEARTAIHYNDGYLEMVHIKDGHIKMPKNPPLDPVNRLPLNAIASVQLRSPWKDWRSLIVVADEGQRHVVAFEPGTLENEGELKAIITQAAVANGAKIGRPARKELGLPLE